MKRSMKGAAAAVLALTLGASMGICALAGENSYKVGIVKFMDHASLNQIEDSIKTELDKLSAENGTTYDYENYTYDGEGDGSVLNQIASSLMADEVDVIVAIATPAVQVMQAATEDTKIPIIFSAVTDPVGAGLVSSMEEPGGKITGTSDALNTGSVMNLIFALKPDADYIGLLYSKSEDASTQPIAQAKAFLDEKGVKYIEKTGTNPDEVSSAADALIAEGVDAVFTPTDNTVMNAELAIYEKLAEAGIPHFCGADSFALNGAFCGFGVNYKILGTATADMTAELLGGADPAKMPVQTFENGIATVNTQTAELLGADMAAVSGAFGPYCSEIVETTTAKDF